MTETMSRLIDVWEDNMHAGVSATDVDLYVGGFSWMEPREDMTMLLGYRVKVDPSLGENEFEFRPAEKAKP